MMTLPFPPSVGLPYPHLAIEGPAEALTVVLVSDGQSIRGPANQFCKDLGIPLGRLWRDHAERCGLPVMRVVD